VDNSMITPKGRLFLELPFDLRMNNFVTLGHEIYDEIENFAIIASILSSPVINILLKILMFFSLGFTFSYEGR